MCRPFSLSFVLSYGKGAAMTEHLTYIPPEWAPHAAIWLGWPHLRDEWGDAFDSARDEISSFAKALCQTTPTRVACGSREAYSSAWSALEHEIGDGLISLHTLPSGDIWVRDTGAIFAQIDGRQIALEFQFNGWGGKFVMPGDALTAGGMASVETVERRRHSFVLEGGAIDLDGAGRLLTTRQCMLHPNRNETWTQTRAEAALRSAFAVGDIIWLGDGLRNDHTDGHVDNIARFAGPGRVVCQSPSGADDPNAGVYAAVKSGLIQAGLEVVEIPSPGRIVDDQGEIMPASHMNFLISNSRVFLPVYEATYAPQAIRGLELVFPDYEILGLPARNILSGGGAFHCMTQQVPRLMES